MFKPSPWHLWPRGSAPGLPSSQGSQVQPLSPSHPRAGSDCSEDVDECESQGPPRCRNGGTCQNSAGSFHCVCVSGWGGTGCEENLDDCVAATCAPGSTCVDRVGSFSCLCPPGRTGVRPRVWEGGRWEEETASERSTRRAAGRFKWPQRASPPSCPPGLLCHMEDMCLSQPCHGEAQCSTNPLTGSTLCLCQPGYSGPTCHQDLDECQMGEASPHQILSESPASLCTEERNGQIVFQKKNINISFS